MEIRRSYDRLISTMRFPKLIRWHLYIESGPWNHAGWCEPVPSCDPENTVKQCSKLSQKSCKSSCLESQIINIKLRKIFKKVPGPPPKLSASGRRTGSNLEHCRKTSNIRCTKSKNSNPSRIGLLWSFCHIWSQVLSEEWRCSWSLEQRRQAMLQLHLIDQQFNCLQRCVLY